MLPVDRVGGSPRMVTTTHNHDVQEITITPEDQSGLTVYRVAIECSCGATMRRNASEPRARHEIADAVARHLRAERASFEAIGMVYVGAR